MTSSDWVLRTDRAASAPAQPAQPADPRLRSSRPLPARDRDGQPPAAPFHPSILLLTTGLNVGGAERVVLDLARAYVDAGLPTRVLALAEHRDLLAMTDTRGIDIRFLGMRKTPLGLAAAARALARLVRDEDIDLVHAHMPHAAFVASTARLLHGLRQPIVHTSHNFAFSAALALPLKLSRRLRDVDVLLAPGQHQQLNAARTAIIPNGIHPVTAPRREPGPQPRLIAVGRLTEQKNFAALIDGFASLQQSGRARGARLDIVGDGPLRTDLAARIEQHGLGASVALLGLRGDVGQLLAAADVFVMSSRFEGLPLAVLEAGAAGLPILAPPVGALPWLLGDDCGFLVPPDRIADGLAEVLGDMPAAQQRARRFQARINERFTLARSVADHLALYQSLLAPA